MVYNEDVVNIIRYEKGGKVQIELMHRYDRLRHEPPLGQRGGRAHMI